MSQKCHPPAGMPQLHTFNKEKVMRSIFFTSNEITSRTIKSAESQELARQTEDFVLSGGVIKSVDFGVSGEKPSEKWSSKTIKSKKDLEK